MKLNVLDSFRLEGRVALVTGASRGLGEVIASALAEAGASLALLARGSRVHQVARALSAEHGVSCRGYQCDVSDAGAVQEAVAAVIADCGGLHIVVNNAGINIRGPIEELSLDQFRQVQDTNLTSMWLLCRAAAAHLKAQGYGRVVNVGSLLSILGMAERTPLRGQQGRGAATYPRAGAGVGAGGDHRQLHHPRRVRDRDEPAAVRGPGDQRRRGGQGSPGALGGAGGGRRNGPLPGQRRSQLRDRRGADHRRRLERALKILFLEPFSGGSNREFADGLVQHSRHRSR